MLEELKELVEQRKQLDQHFRRKEKDLESHRRNWRDACKKIELKLVEICEHDYTRENLCLRSIVLSSLSFRKRASLATIT